MNKLFKGEGGNHYKENGKTEVIENMEEVAVNIIFSESVENGITPHIIKKAMNASYAEKHLKRAGTKKMADVDSELLKAENYLHRARTGEWIS